MKHIVIIGGGVSGMTAAITAAEHGPSARITILEHKAELGKKILVTGNGRCNLTNHRMTEACYRSEDPRWIKHLTERFRWQDTVRFFEDLGLPVRDRDGYVYPRSNQASSVRRILVRRLKELQVQVILGAHVSGVIPVAGGFEVWFSTGGVRKKCSASRVILSSGGKAAPVQGSDGSGYSIARSFGHTIVPVVPALVQLKIENHPLAKAAGVRTEAKVAVTIDGKEAAQDTGELQITSYGLSGIPVFQVSRYAARGLLEQKKVAVQLDLVPEMSENQLRLFFRQRQQHLGSICQSLTLEDYLCGIFPDKLIIPVLKQAKLSGRIRVPDLEHSQMDLLVSACKNISLSVEDTNGFENAQVCAGGVSTGEILPATMESCLQPGLFLAGEVLDVDGICGGYNIHHAVISGMIAGKSASEEERRS